MSSASDDADDFQAVAGMEQAGGKFRWSDGLAVVLDYDTAGEKVLGDQEILQRARNGSVDLFAVSGDHVSAASQSFQTGS